MRRAKDHKPKGPQVSRTYSVQVPVRGWNARDSIASMKPGDAYELDNWFPTASDVMMRKGSASHVTGLPAAVETLVSYRPMTGSHSLWAFSNDGLYNVTSAGAVGAAAVSSLTNAQWQTTNFTTTGGNFLLAVNGADSMLHYDGSSWAAITGASTPAITGVTTSTLVNVNVFKERVWYVQTASMSVWYSAVGAFAGALTELNLGSIFKRGGYLVAMGTWTLDGGSGIDDLAVFITSQGEVAVYQGTNPASANTWALVGIFHVGAPIGRRCLVKFGSDLLMITQDGILPASKAFSTDRLNKDVALSDRISGALSYATNAYSTNFGWSLTQYPGGNMLILNVPITTSDQRQYVMNTTTGAWCSFSGWPANCFEVHNGDLYYGGSTVVRKAWTGTADLGALITAEGVGAFDYFQSRDSLKAVRMMRPVIGWDTNPADFLVGVDVDFIVNTPTGSIAFASVAAGTWDSGTWDSATWGGSVATNRAWYTANGLGYAIAPHILVSSSTAEVRWIATDYLYEPGAVL